MFHFLRKNNTSEKVKETRSKPCSISSGRVPDAAAAAKPSSETRTGRTAWIYRLFRPTQKTSGGESGPQTSPRPTGSDSCWIFPCFRKKRKVAPCEGTEQKTPHTPHRSPAREAPCEVTEVQSFSPSIDDEEEDQEQGAEEEEKKKVPKVQRKVPEVQEEKKKVPEVQRKVPEVQEEKKKEEKKKVPEVQEEKKKVPEVQEEETKVPEVQEEKKKVPEVQEETEKKVLEVQEEKKKVPEVQEEKTKVPEVQEETEKVELPVIGGKKETNKKEDKKTVPIHDTSPIRKGERYVPVNEGVRGGRQDWLGFPNPGNLCYMNSSLQGLLTLKGFIGDLSQQQEVWSHLPEAQVIRRFMNIVGCHRSADRTLKCWVLLLFKKALSVRAPEFRNNRQQDAHEFLTTVLDQMRGVAPQLQDIAARLGRVYRCPVEDHLVFRMQNTRTCRSCGAGSTREEDYTNLSLKLLPGASVGDMLQSYLMETELDFRCDCGSHRSVQQPAFKTLPKVLILHVRRICFTPSMQLVKLSDPVTIFRELMVSSTEDTGWYSLVSIINHLGNNTSSGHYISDVLHPEAGLDDPSDRWLTCNDAQVTRTTGEAVCQERRDTAFILFYQRRQL
nr:ubiquitin carboxyl-terminal hydrolase 29-like [Pseudochaenichthys georgianus]